MVLLRLTGFGEALSENVRRPSITVNVVVAVLVLPAASVAVIVIVCVPTANYSAGERALCDRYWSTVVTRSRSGNDVRESLRDQCHLR